MKIPIGFIDTSLLKAAASMNQTINPADAGKYSSKRHLDIASCFEFFSMHRLLIVLLYFASWQYIRCISVANSENQNSKSFADYVKRNSLLSGVSLWESIQMPGNALSTPNKHHISPRDGKTADYISEEEEDYDFETSTVAPSFDDHLNHSAHEKHPIHVASWQWEYVRTPFIYTAVVIVAGFCKIGFHHAGFFSSVIPESCMLILLGIVVGSIVHFTHSRETLPQFTPKAFFLFLLPPIVLESAYSLHDRAFFSNLGTIILYAVVGTIINCFCIGLSLYGLIVMGAVGNIQINLIQCLVFSALISAVDPVAVLAIFQEVGVNKNLYFLVFGESLLNDAVTIVLYMMMVGFSKAEYITVEQVGMGIAAFICVSLGGLFIGILMGIFTALITKHTAEVRVVEPLAMIGVAYLSYLLAEMVHFSGIISIIGCGIVQAHYASKNISDKSNTTVKYFTKMVSAVCDTIIFLFLGMVLVNDQHVWHTGFVMWSTFLCLVVRFISVFVLTYGANKLERTRRINEEEQFIMAYGGLRGAVAFSLVVMLEDNESKNLFITATLFIILFTVFIQGATIKPLVILLKIRRQAAKHTSSLFTEVNKKLLDHVMAGVEEITGDHGGNYWKQLLFYYNNKYLKKWLQCNDSESNLTRVYTRMMLEDHFAHLYGPAAVIEDNKPLLLHKLSTEEDEILEVLPPLPEEDEEETHKNENGESEEVIFRRPSRHSVKIDMKDIEETKPLKNKREKNSDTPIPGHPPLIKTPTNLSLFSKSTDDDPSRLLQKALHDNPYNKLHHKYNPNLVDDQDQDLSVHLKARRLRTRRLTLLAMHGDSATPERRPSGEDQILQNRLVPLAASYFLERAQKRRTLKPGEDPVGNRLVPLAASRFLAKTQKRPTTIPKVGDANDSCSGSTEKPVKLERQCAILNVKESNSMNDMQEEKNY